MTNRKFFIQTWLAEMKITLNAINGMPVDKTKWNYKCNEKSRNAAEIIGHILPHAEVISNSIKTGIADERTKPHQFSSVEDAIAYSQKWATFNAKNLDVMDDTAWDQKIIDFQVDGVTFYELPMDRYCWMLLIDIIHHRGQLSTYYRHMGVRIPNIYGPTAEDFEAMMAGKS